MHEVGGIVIITVSVCLSVHMIFQQVIEALNQLRGTVDLRTRKSGYILGLTGILNKS